MTELYTPNPIKQSEEEALMCAYESELTKDGETKADRERRELLLYQNAELFTIENKFDNPDEWTRMRVEDFAIHIKDKPEGGEITPDDLQVWMWDDSKKGWFWQGKQFIEENPEPEPAPGEFQFTTRLLLNNGRKLTICRVNKLTKENGVIQELRGIYDDSGEKLEPVATPAIRLDHDSQERLSSPVKSMPPELSSEELERLKAKRLANQERSRQIRSKHGLGATAIGNRARI